MSSSINTLPASGVSLQWAAPEWNNVMYFTQSLTGLSEDYKLQLANKFRSVDTLFVGYLKAPAASSATLKMVIGAGGHWLKQTTTLKNVYFIWHEKKIETFIIWGPQKAGVEDSLKVLAWRLNKYQAAQPLPAAPVPAAPPAPMPAHSAAAALLPGCEPITPPTATEPSRRSSSSAFTTPPPPIERESSLDYDPRVCAPLKKNPLRRSPSPAKQQKIDALTALFLTAEELEPLNSTELSRLYNTFCEPAPIYSDTELENFCAWTQLLPSDIEDALNIKHLPLIHLLDFALIQSSTHLLQLLSLHVSFSDPSIASYVYLLYMHTSSKRFTTDSPADELGFERLLILLLSYGPAFHPTLLSWAVNGTRKVETFKPADFLNYIHPSLLATMKIVPAYITRADALECYRNFDACTYSCNSSKDYKHPYEKSELILAYLKSLPDPHFEYAPADSAPAAPAL
jgi:hypothetical protein